jgi:hypothetical protein
MQGVNTYFERDMQFARKRPKSGGRELNFEHSDCFLNNQIMYAYSHKYRYSYAASFCMGV